MKGGFYMSGFKNINIHRNLTENILKGFKDRINNPYLLYSDKKQSIVTYYNINTESTTIDPGIQTHYSNLGDQSPLRFNKINNTYLYGIGRVELNASYGDWGVEGSEITGECVTLPNTFQPFPNDYFSINYLDRDLLFKVISVTPDTLDNGANFYKIEYKLDQHGWEEGTIEDKVEKVFNMKITNFGTNRKVIMTEEESEFEDSMEDLVAKLQIFYSDIFYDTTVQTFAFSQDGAKFYDPYMIEFIIRNDILNMEEFLYIAHATVLSKFFGIEYSKSIFTAVENRRMDQVKKFNNQFCGIAVEEPNSLLSHHSQAYYQMTYSKVQLSFTVAKFMVFNTDLYEHIVNNQLYTENNKLCYNILINYFNGVDSTLKDINLAIEYMDIIDGKESFYLIPFLIYILNKNTDSVLDSNSATSD